MHQCSRIITQLYILLFLCFQIRKSSSSKPATENKPFPRQTPKAIIFEKEYRPKLDTKPWNKFRNNAKIKERLLQRMQTQGMHDKTGAIQGRVSATKPQGAMSLILHNIRTNGLKGLYGGITAGLQRQVAFCAVRIGCYDSIKEFYQELLPNGKWLLKCEVVGKIFIFLFHSAFQK